MNYKYVFAVCMVCLGLSVLIAMGYFDPKPAPGKTVAVIATPAPEVRHETRIEIPAKTLKVYAPATKTKLKLPDSVIQNDAQHVAAATRIQANDRPVTVTAVVDADTGETLQFIKEEPDPWFAVNTTREASLFLLSGNRGNFVQGEIRQGLFNVKSLNFGAKVSVNKMLGGQAETVAGIGVWGRF